MEAAPARVNPACGPVARPPCGSNDRQRQGTGGAACGRASREPQAAQGPVAGARWRSEAEGRLVPVPQPFLAERVVDSAGDRVADPHDEAEQEDGEYELQSGDHESSPDFHLAAMD